MDHLAGCPSRSFLPGTNGGRGLEIAFYSRVEHALTARKECSTVGFFNDCHSTESGDGTAWDDLEDDCFDGAGARARDPSRGRGRLQRRRRLADVAAAADADFGVVHRPDGRL